MKIRRLEDADNRGWISAVEERWTFASADDPAFTLNVSGEFTWKYCNGQRVRLQQGCIKNHNRRRLLFRQYGSDAPQGHGLDLARSPIIEPYFWAARAPFGFPLDESKWRDESLAASDGTQASPVAGTWYNKGGSLVVLSACGGWSMLLSWRLSGLRQGCSMSSRPCPRRPD